MEPGEKSTRRSIGRISRVTEVEPISAHGCRMRGFHQSRRFLLVLVSKQIFTSHMSYASPRLYWSCARQYIPAFRHLDEQEAFWACCFRGFRSNTGSVVSRIGDLDGQSWRTSQCRITRKENDKSRGVPPKRERVYSFHLTVLDIGTMTIMSKPNFTLAEGMVDVDRRI